MAFTVRGGKIVEIDILHDPERLSQLDLTVLDGFAVDAFTFGTPFGPPPDGRAGT
jgi:hypothetical protein